MLQGFHSAAVVVLCGDGGVGLGVWDVGFGVCGWFGRFLLFLRCEVAETHGCGLGFVVLSLWVFAFGIVVLWS